MSLQPTEACRFPAITDEGRAFLKRMAEHPNAPNFRDASGNRLHAEEIESARVYHALELDAPACSSPRPDWLESFLLGIRAQVPFFRHWPEVPFAELPTTSRADLAKDVAAFVPDPLPVDRLMRFDTTGTTGHRIVIPSHPTVAARHLVYLRKALRLHGIGLTAGRGQVGVVLAGFQERCFTYHSVNPLFDEAGVLKLNLHPNDWAHPSDRAKYLDAMKPEVISGDPLSLPELACLGMTHRAKAILSTSMAMSPGLRADLEGRLGCPVVDVYSLNESGPVAAKAPGEEGFHLLQSRLLVEIVDGSGAVVPDGERGEICLTGGFNPWLPMCRYRTGDWARKDPDRPWVLLDLEGRAPVRFLDGRGTWQNNIEVSQALADRPLAQFRLVQRADATLELFLRPGEADGHGIARVVQELLGRDVKIVSLTSRDKVITYESEMRNIFTIAHPQILFSPPTQDMVIDRNVR